MYDYSNQRYCEAFGKKVAQLRKARGLNVEDLARLTGLSPMFVTMIENGRPGLLTDELVSKFCVGCGCKAFDLKAETERVTAVYALVNEIEALLSGDDGTHDKALSISDVVRDAACIGYRTAMKDVMSSMAALCDCQDVGLVSGFYGQASVSVEKEAEMLSKISFPRRKKSAPKGNPLGGMQEDREEYGLTEEYMDAREFVDNFVQFDF